MTIPTAPASVLWFATIIAGAAPNTNHATDALDHLVGNRESHTTREGVTTAYTLATAANEYATVGGAPVLYDAAGNPGRATNACAFHCGEAASRVQGNLIQDEAGWQYVYDERSLLTQVKDDSGGALANYTYDALGRRIIFEDVVAGTTKRYYYDGASLIQERNGSDVLTQYHVSGRQYIDERVATMDSGGDWIVHLMGNNFSVMGDGDDAGAITRTAYGTLGDFVDPPAPSDSGTFTLHGRPIDVLSDGTRTLVLMHVRARVYDPKNARWLQRDPSGYVDGSNLYESFHGNTYSSVDPSGRDDVERAGDDLIYKGPGFQWVFARGLGANLSITDIPYQELVVIDHPNWPYAFAMRREDAQELFDTHPEASDFTSVLEVMQYASKLANDAATRSKIVGTYPKKSLQNYPGGWTRGVELDTGDMQELEELAKPARLRAVQDLEHFTKVAATLSYSSLAAPTGLGGAAVDAGALVSDMRQGKVSMQSGGVVLTATAAGYFLHLKFADTARRGAGAGGRAAQAMAEEATTLGSKELPVLRISAREYPQLAENILHAQKAGHPSILTHGGAARANRAAALEGVPNIRPLSRDEYPFASSVEGGAGSWVGHIPPAQQRAQGGLITEFLRRHNIQPGDQYIVVVDQ